jgi:hypothetical protein
MAFFDRSRDPLGDEQPPVPRMSTLLLLVPVVAIFFVMTVYGITNSVGPDTSTNASAVTRAPKLLKGLVLIAEARRNFRAAVGRLN